MSEQLELAIVALQSDLYRFTHVSWERSENPRVTLAERLYYCSRSTDALCEVLNAVELPRNFRSVFDPEERERLLEFHGVVTQLSASYSSGTSAECIEARAVRAVLRFTRGVCSLLMWMDQLTWVAAKKQSHQIEVSELLDLLSDTLMMLRDSMRLFPDGEEGLYAAIEALRAMTIKKQQALQTRTATP